MTQLPPPLPLPPPLVWQMPPPEQPLRRLISRRPLCRLPVNPGLHRHCQVDGGYRQKGKNSRCGDAPLPAINLWLQSTAAIQNKKS